MLECPISRQALRRERKVRYWQRQRAGTIISPTPPLNGLSILTCANGRALPPRAAGRYSGQSGAPSRRAIPRCDQYEPLRVLSMVKLVG